MIQRIYALDSHLPIYISEFRNYLLQNSSVSFSGHILHKMWTHTRFKFEYLSMLPSTSEEVSMMDILFIINPDKSNQAFAVYGEYAVEIPLSEAFEQAQRNEEIALLEGRMNVSSENLNLFLEVYNRCVFSKETLDKMTMLKEFVQGQERTPFENMYYDYCESIITARNLRLKAIMEGKHSVFMKQYHQFQ